MSEATYDELLHRLARVRDVDAEEVADATARLQRDKTKVTALRNALDGESHDIAEVAQMLSAPVLDLRAPADPHAPDSTLDRELAAGHARLTEAANARKAALAAGKLPGLLPKAHHLIRNTCVYGGILAGVFLVQLALFYGLHDERLTMWIACVPPLLGVLAGYVTIGVTAKPRVATVDKHGKPIPFKVYKSPRLGVALAVLAIVAFVLLTSTRG